MKSPRELASIARSIQIDIDEFMSASSAGAEESVTLEFEIDTNAMTDRLGELLQAAFDAHTLSLVDSRTVAALCYHEILGIPLLEAKSLAEQSITE